MKDRLSRRGLTVASSALGAGWLTPATQAAPPAAWIESTVRTAMQVAASRSPVEVLPAAVLSIVKGVSRGLCLSNLRRALVATLTLGTLAAGATVLAWSGLQEPAGEPNQQPAPPATVAAPGAAKTGLQELKDEGSADLRGSWEVLYITGSASGKRAGHMLPGLAVTISDRTISLPSVTGKAEGPLRSLGEQAYTALPGLKEADEEVAAAEEQVRWHRITLRRLERAAREKQVPETALVRARKQIDFDEARLGNIQKKREARRAVTSAVESQIDIESPTEGGKVWQGIYWHRPGTLTICYDTSGRARPETFACNQPSECLIILRDGGAELHAVPQQIVPAGQHQQLSLRPARP